MNKRKKEFLEEYDYICNKYGMIINSCGCCESPWVEDLEYTLNKKYIKPIDELIENHIKYLKGDSYSRT